jgi:hemerythrin-like metal-binding protein
VGDPDLDREHQMLVGIINGLVDAVEAGPDPHRGDEVWHQVLSEIVLYAENHFRHEEQRMAEVDYGELDEHRAGHLRFRARVAEFMARESGGVESLLRAHRFLSEWLKDHVLRVDQGYAPYLRASV